MAADCQSAWNAHPAAYNFPTMQHASVLAALLLGLAVTATGATAADAPPSPAAPASAAAPEVHDRGGDPAIRRSVIEDDQVKVEELRVRGQTERIVVSPKHAGRPYEILTNPNGRDPGGSADGRRGATGQRVWTVLGF
jgi:lipoprotein-anchoring transpeptidase ErfK/SrfK